jgi:succinyl-diaminopimelate desuccinylase
VDYQVEWTLGSSPFLSPPGRLVDVMGKAVTAVTGVTPELSTAGGTSDGRFLAAISTELVEFGPVNATIHAVDERVRLKDIAPLSTIYERAVTALLAGQPS